MELNELRVSNGFPEDDEGFTLRVPVIRQSAVLSVDQHITVADDENESPMASEPFIQPVLRTSNETVRTTSRRPTGDNAPHPCQPSHGATADPTTGEGFVKGRLPRPIASVEEMSTNEKELKLSLFYHISNPFTRLKIYRVFPLKFAVHLIKTLCIVTQAILFIQSPSGMQSVFQSEVQKVVSSLFVQPDVLASVTGKSPLAPSTVYTAYRIQDVKAALDFAGFRFGNLSRIAQGYEYAKNSEGFPLPIEVTLTAYASDKLDAAKKSYVLNVEKNSSSFFLDPEAGIGIVDQLNGQCADNCIERFLTLDLTFRANDIRIMQPTQVQCYNVTSKLQFVASNGRLLHTYTVKADLKCMDCVNYIQAINTSGDFHIILGFRVTLGFIVLAICITSFYLTIKALMTSYKLAKAMGTFYREQLHKNLSWKERMILFEYWHAINILSDLCTVVGTALVIRFDQNYNCSQDIPYDSEGVRILLGIGIVLQAGVIIRYVSYFPKFNVLSRTLEIAFPRLLKYVIFVTILFTAFMFCGWVVLSPFHYKFSSFYESFYTLFTMMNGDDLYNTFVGFNIAESTLVYIFSQAYFTSFMALFIYAILNLFVSLVVEAREDSQNINPLLKNEVRRFLFSGSLTEGGVALRDLGLVQQDVFVEPDVILQSKAN